MPLFPAALFPAAAVDFLSVSRIDKPCPTSPATTSLIPSVPLRMVRFDPAIPWAAACTIDGSASMMRLAAMSSWLPSLSEPARAGLRLPQAVFGGIRTTGCR